MEAEGLAESSDSAAAAPKSADSHSEVAEGGPAPEVVTSLLKSVHDTAAQAAVARAGADEAAPAEEAAESGADAAAQPRQVRVELQTIAGEMLTSALVTPGMTCGSFKMQIVDLLPSGRCLDALLLGSEVLDNAQPMDVEDGAVLTAVLGHPRFQQSDADDGIIIEDGGNCASLKSRGGSFYPSALIPVPLAAGQQHYFEVELCWSGVTERRKISFRMGICRERPRMGYLGKAQDEFSFWWDDGDIYHRGNRYRPGGLTKSHPMAIGDRVGVIVDLRHPVAPLEFVLNRKSTGPFLRHTVKHLVLEGAPLYPCVSFCLNHVGCFAKLTHLGPPPTDIVPWNPDETEWPTPG
ncbi:unnamed protein product [Symbiodinium sp. CCMP2592]|nr:unnamed protein product [Symbiodinium sp. CCMP2592]